MLKRLVAIFSISLLLDLSPVIANALTNEEINQIGKEITVFVDGCSSGSGVLYKKEGNTYSVLTANHVLTNPTGCLIITSDGFRNRANQGKIVPVNGLDLAVITFNSNKQYPLAKFGDSNKVTYGDTVYVFGAPQPNQTVMNRVLRISQGKITGIAENADAGYNLIYDNTTRKGMSGGTILNEDGELIGIHGRGDQADGSKENYGIPVALFKNNLSGISINIPSNQNPVVDESGEGFAWGGWVGKILGGGVVLFIVIYVLGNLFKPKQASSVINKPSSQQ